VVNESIIKRAEGAEEEEEEEEEEAFAPSAGQQVFSFIF
jgi:hypothetical protein